MGLPLRTAKDLCWAQDDRTVTSMVPASVRVRREEASASSRAVLGPGAGKGRPTVGPGFGLAPALFTSRSALSTSPAQTLFSCGACCWSPKAVGLGGTAQLRGCSAHL